ncbi:reprolysin-like metallopeptidase [Flavobacterium sp. PL002]|uniref:reprolysin-like metallopeptidase n=1 Tax=Flavobacterium sp. PL002 TaxID=1897058 RepID=UPI001787B246|nr:hypothetical protein [Flavobacterium sp. PL002]MBE0393711.1 hypothetical protein [Flavobacterium sp. PL002]
MGISYNDYEPTERKEREVEETTSSGEELVLFFRSETQAQGFPKRDKRDKIKINGVEQFKPLEDLKYAQSFGFDYYRPDLYGSDTKIYEGGVATGHKLEDNFEIDNQLSLELKNKKGKSKFIDNEFTLVNSSSSTNYKYFIPNLLVIKGKTITFYAKYLCPDNTGVSAKITLSDATGIDNYTQDVSFNKSEEIKPITITTSASVNIAIATILSITIEKEGVTTVIGKCNILPNKQYEPNFIFIDVIYNSTIASSTDYSKFVKNLNEKAFNQAGINIVKSKNQYTLHLKPNDALRVTDSKEPIVNSNIVSNSINATNQITNFDNVLEIASYKFYEGIALKLMNEIEVELKKIKVKDKSKKDYPLIKTTESLEEIIKTKDGTNDEKQKRYNRLINNIIGFIKESKINYLIGFMCSNLESVDDSIALGYLNTRGFIVSKSGTSDFMTCAHEIGHNFNLGHTFLKAGQVNDLQIPMTETLENIMDYLSGNPPPRKSFMAFQWFKMQKSLDRYAISDKDIDTTSTGILNGFNCLKDNTSNYLGSLNLYLKFFTYEIIRSIFLNIEDSNKITLLHSDKDENDALNIISEIIKNTIKELQS